MTHCYSLLSFEEVLEIVVFHPVVGLLTKGEDLPHGDAKGPGNLSFAQLYKWQSMESFDFTRHQTWNWNPFCWEPKTSFISLHPNSHSIQMNWFSVVTSGGLQRIGKASLSVASPLLFDKPKSATCRRFPNMPRNCRFLKLPPYRGRSNEWINYFKVLF